MAAFCDPEVETGAAHRKSFSRFGFEELHSVEAHGVESWGPLCVSRVCACRTFLPPVHVAQTSGDRMPLAHRKEQLRGTS